MALLSQRLRFRLIILVLLAIIPTVMVIIYSGMEERRQAMSEAQAGAMRLARLASLNQERIIQASSQLLELIAQLPIIEEGDPSSLTGFLARLLENSAYYTNLSLISNDGEVLASAMPMKGRVNVSDHPWFQRALESKGFLIGEYHIGRVTGKPSLPLSYPVMDKSGKLKYIIYAGLALHWFNNNIAAQVQLPPGATLAMVDRKGTILARYPAPEEWMGRTIPEMENIRHVLAQEEGTAAARGGDGVARLYAFATLKNIPEGIFVRLGIPQKIVFAQANWILWRNIITIGVIAIVALAAAWLFGSIFIMRDVNILVNAARQIGAGDLSKRTGISRGEGEIQQLAQAFDEMVGELQKRIADLNQTQDELTLTNQYLENVFDNSADSIGIVDEKGYFTRWNKAGMALYGYTLQEIKGKSAFEIYPDKDKLEKMLTQLRRDGYVRNYEIEMRRKDGRIAPFALSINLLCDLNKKSCGSVCVARDLSDVKNALAESEILNKSLHAEINERQQVETALNEALESLKHTFYEIEQRNREISLLNGLGDMLQTCLTRQEAYNSIAKFGPQLFPHLSGVLFILNPRKSLLLENVAAWGNGQGGEQVFTIEECWALRRGETHLVQDSATDLRCKHAPPGVEECLCIPMIAQGEIVGMLFLHSPARETANEPKKTENYLTEASQSLAVTVAKQISLALANLSLRESLHMQAIIDPLTGLFNRRYMEETFEREMFRGKRAGRPIGVIMADIDHFKRINDNFGHEAGDMLLAAIAGLFKKNIRHEDIPCRFGGEEFLLILPEVPVEKVYQRAETLRRLVSQLEINHLGRPLGNITASFGVASYPDHGEKVEDIIRAADTALYLAKNMGRNQVILASNETTLDDHQ